MLERLADQIRPLVAWRPDPAGPTQPPKGATGDGGFKVTPDMMSILGCSSVGVGEVLQTLGFRLERVPPAPAKDQPAAELAGAVAGPGDGAGEANGANAPAPVSADVAATPVGQEGGGGIGEPAGGNGPDEAKWEEIWRPRRQGRRSDRPRRRRGGPAGQSEEVQPVPRKREVWRSRRQGKKRAPGGREDRTRPYSQTAAPTPKTGIDPDSPFAALISLKAALEKQNQE
jgi:ATP-dependent RNA helicase SUPV3L1/SUV3